MYKATIKKDGKSVWTGWVNDPRQVATHAMASLHADSWDEITVRKPAVAVLPTQAELEASGKKD